MVGCKGFDVDDSRKEKIQKIDDKFQLHLYSFPEMTQPDSSIKICKQETELQIITKGPPCPASARRLSPDKLTVAKVKFKEIEDLGIKRKSKSASVLPLFMVPKENGDWRPCLEYQQLNDLTIPDRYFIPHIQDFSDNQSGSQIFLKIDLLRAITRYHDTRRYS